MDTVNKSPYNYKLWINTALLEVIKKTIKTIEENGLYKGIHFFITFNTNHYLVKLPASLKDKYPTTMTIVLQNQFYDLKTDKNGFMVKLYFSSVLTELFIPWNSIVQVLDPITPISLNIVKLENINSVDTSLNITENNKNNVIKFPTPKSR